MNPINEENYIRPEDVSANDAARVLTFLNTAKSAEEIAEAVEISGERDVGIKVAQNILEKRAQLGSFSSLAEVNDVSQVGPERFTEIIITLRDREVQQLLVEIEQQRQQAEKQGLNFTTPTAEQLRRKLSKTDSPMIVWQSWGGGAPGGSIGYNLGIKNPDPFIYNSLFVHVFIGLANPVSDIGVALTTVDSRFPRLTLPKFAGLSINPGVTESLSFSIHIPTNIEPGYYLGNSFLFRADWHDVGDYFDRGTFVFEVT